MKGFNVCLEGGLGLTAPPSLSSPFRCSVLELPGLPRIQVKLQWSVLLFFCGRV